jgi:hypothetical protein
MMKRLVWLSLALIGFFSIQGAQASPERSPHLELELDSQGYRSFLGRPGIFSLSGEVGDLVALGKRNLDFLDHLNSKRPADQKLSLTSPELQPGYPIDAPKESSPRILRERLDAVQKEIPASLARVLFEGGDFPDQLEVSDEVYLLWSRKMDGIYQGASRWTLQEPYLESYKRRRSQDVRGFYFLTHESDWQKKISEWASLDSGTQARIRPWLHGLCLNSGSSLSACASSLRQAESSGQVLSWVNGYLPRSERLWRSFFELGGKRMDVHWDRRRPELTLLPFRDPGEERVRSFLVDNIEDEWRLPGWNLRLDFGGTSWNTAEIVFEAGATPHVNGLGGSTITMDSNQSLMEYGTRWTIRHEFGHVLGLPDCYIEFYDSDREVMVSYQLDLGNLMCSRRGKLLPIHFDELKKAYFK